jgi:sterol desaturase/sphingolipid hydroxylase (fatty acid hydroxylase superfamily)
MSQANARAHQHDAAGVPAFSRFVARALFPTCLTFGLGAALMIIHFGLPLVWITGAIPALMLLIVAVMERVMPYDPAANRSHGDLKADLSCVVLVAGVLESSIGVIYPAIAATVYVHFNEAGLLKSAFPSDWPLLLQAVLLLLLSDLAKYWFHRFGHETDLGWRLHSVHHAVKRVYWLNGFRIHPLYHLINFIIAVLPWVCLGASAEVVALYTVMLATSAAFQHANVKLEHGFLNYVFNTNTLHRWHHSRVLHESNANYGAVILLWDLLFGTYRVPEDGAPAEYGMVNETGYPINSYFKQLIVPFQSPVITEAGGNHGRNT